MANIPFFMGSTESISFSLRIVLFLMTSILIFILGTSSSFIGENLVSFDIASTVLSIISRAIFSCNSLMFPDHHLTSPFLYMVTKTHH
jgi:hypothetical protein